VEITQHLDKPASSAADSSGYAIISQRSPLQVVVGLPVTCIVHLARQQQRTAHRFDLRRRPWQQNQLLTCSTIAQQSTASVYFKRLSENVKHTVQ